MKELVLTHNINGIANIAIVDYSSNTVAVKRVPSDSPILKSLLQSGKIRKCYSELRDDSDIWLLKSAQGWILVSCDGVVSNTRDSKRLEKDAAAFLATFVEVPVWSDKSKVFVAKLIQMGHRVALRPYIKVAGMLSPEVSKAFAVMSGMSTELARAFSSMPEVDIEASESVSQLEIWGHTLNVLYGSNMELLDISLLGALDWLPPLICRDTILWRGITSEQDRKLYVYLKGDTVLYVGYTNLKEADFHRYAPEVREVLDVLTFENLISPSCEGLLETNVDYTRQDAPVRKVRVCNEVLSQVLENRIVEFLFDSMTLIDVIWETLPNDVEVQKSFLYDLVNNKIYLFKSYNTYKLGTYYGEMSVDEWRERKVP